MSLIALVLFMFCPVDVVIRSDPLAMLPAGCVCRSNKRQSVDTAPCPELHGDSRWLVRPRHSHSTCFGLCSDFDHPTSTSTCVVSRNLDHFGSDVHFRVPLLFVSFWPAGEVASGLLSCVSLGDCNEPGAAAVAHSVSKKFFGLQRFTSIATSKPHPDETQSFFVFWRASEEFLGVVAIPFSCHCWSKFAA